VSAGTTEHLAVVPAHYRIQTPLGPDRSVPIRLSQALRDARPDLIELETFDADHTLCWNTDPGRWQNTVTTWLKACAPS